MNEDTLIKEGLRDWAQEAHVPADLADRALRARRRRRFGFTGFGAVLVAAAVVALRSCQRDARVAGASCAACVVGRVVSRCRLALNAPTSDSCWLSSTDRSLS